MVKPESRRGSFSPYNCPTITLTQGLKKPVPMMMRASPSRNTPMVLDAVSGDTMTPSGALNNSVKARQMCPRAMMLPPNSIDRCVPRKRSAAMPPKIDVMYTRKV
jgi:hypothetical protein